MTVNTAKFNSGNSHLRDSHFEALQLEKQRQLQMQRD